MAIANTQGIGRSSQRRISCTVTALVLGASPFVDAAEKQTAQMPTAQRSSGGKHFLWEITDAKAPVYLLGSIHAMRRADYPLPRVIESAIRESQQFYFEWDFDQGPVFQRKVRAAASYPRGVRLRDKISPELYDYLSVYSGGQMREWDRLKPWAISMYLVRRPRLQGIEPYLGIDGYVYRKAKMMRRPVYGLATVEEHLAVMSDMSDVEGEVYLRQALAFAHKKPANLREAIAAWKVGDTERVDALTMPRNEDAPRLNQRLNDDRNVRWMPRIEGAIDSGKSTMIVAGAIHFSGPADLVSLLRARGYTVEQL